MSTGTSVRLFLAVDIDPHTRARMTATRQAIERVIVSARVPPHLTWVNPAIAHVTVRFIGETRDDQIATIQSALSSLAVKPFRVVWQRVGAFGGTRNPRVLWLAPVEGAEAFADLAGEVNRRLDPIIGPGEQRPFKPHLTLARVRDSGRGVDWRAALEAVGTSPTVTEVDHVTLYRSHLSPQGPTYTALSSHG